jgi:hypothetical protein
MRLDEIDCSHRLASEQPGKTNFLATCVLSGEANHIVSTAHSAQNPPSPFPKGGQSPMSVDNSPSKKRDGGDLNATSTAAIVLQF